MRSRFLAFALVFGLPHGSLRAEPLSPALYGGVEDIGAEGDNKWPSVVAHGGNVYVGWGSRAAANVVSRTEDQGPFAPLGDPPGVVGDNPTYFNVRVAGAPDGTLHAVWIDGSVANAVQLLHRAYASGAWSPTRDVSPSYDFVNGARVVVRPSGELFAVWSAPCEGVGNLVFSRSNDAGTSWSAPQCIEMDAEAYAGISSVGTAANGDVHLACAGGSVWHTVWNGRSFTSTRVTEAADDFDATLSVGPDGRAVFGFRKVGQGAYWAQQNEGGYHVEAFPMLGEVIGPVPVVVDGAGNVHAAWLATSAGSQEVWYAVKAPGDSFSAPLLAVPADGGFMSNLDLALSLGADGSARAHLVWEGWPGEIQVRHQQVRTACAACPATCEDGLCPAPHEDGDETSGSGTSADTEASTEGMSTGEATEATSSGSASHGSSTTEPAGCGCPSAPRRAAWTPALLLLLAGTSLRRRVHGSVARRP